MYSRRYPQNTEALFSVKLEKLEDEELNFLTNLLWKSDFALSTKVVTYEIIYLL